MNGPNIVEQYWTGVANQLQVEAGVFSRLVGHNGEVGRANELALAQLVSSLLPSAVGVGTGVIFDSSGNRSTQTDLIIYDKSAQPQILAHSTQLLFPVETVLAAVEVKTTVDTAAITDSGKKFLSIRNLRPRLGCEIPLTVFFGYSVSNAPKARAIELNALPLGERPEVACVLDPGIVSSPSGDGLNAGLVPLHDVDEDGARLSRSWISQANGGRIVRNSTTFPVAGLELYRDWVIFEPGRALLLFAEALLSALAVRTSWNLSWLSGHVTDIARETVIPES